MCADFSGWAPMDLAGGFMFRLSRPKGVLLHFMQSSGV